MDNIININDLSENDLKAAKQLLVLHNNEVFKFFDEGCTRYVYVNKDKSKVVKINKDTCLNSNQEESEIYQSAETADKELMAVTKLINGYIEQEFVLPVKFGGKKMNKEQRIFSDSCRGEVGWRANGQLVCFDLDEYKKY